ncbi:LuxR C-terminal-related transcriptional regulator [Streptomyces sp. NPDC051776]|uniref:helix-turn-helix transcriptional regulator n=1 Tax=Streptomyces sp. NPDC051776 TaxID=3155414 RepID=UPI00342DCA30
MANRFEETGLLPAAAHSYAAAAEIFSTRPDFRSASAAAAQAARLTERCEGAQSFGLSLASSPSPLTTREQEIALLAAQGLTNQEIADQRCHHW